MTLDSDPIAREGYSILLVSWLAAMFAMILVKPLGIALTLWAVFGAYFFRNPKRKTPADGLICPADGKIIFIGKEIEPNFLNREMHKISIFMSPFNVHVNRAPESGVVRDSIHHTGKFFAAFDARASTHNERHAVHLAALDGADIVFVQVAGWFARRIVNYLKPGDSLERGKIFGLIKFGSRMDVYFPDTYRINVQLGDRVKAGESVLALDSVTCP